MIMKNVFSSTMNGVLDLTCQVLVEICYLNRFLVVGLTMYLNKIYSDLLVSIIFR